MQVPRQKKVPESENRKPSLQTRIDARLFARIDDMRARLLRSPSLIGHAIIRAFFEDCDDPQKRLSRAIAEIIAEDHAAAAHEAVQKASEFDAATRAGRSERPRRGGGGKTR